MSGPAVPIALGYSIERAVYLSIYGLVFIFVLLEIRADWARKSFKRSINVYHARQHWLQLLCAFVSLIECVDVSTSFGIWPRWLVGFCGSVGGACDLCILQVSAYLLTKAHFALVNENPRWLVPVFYGIAGYFAIVHIPLQTVSFHLNAGPYFMIDCLVLASVIVAHIVISDIVFFRIRRAVIVSDNQAPSTSKVLPQLMRIGRKVAAENVFLLGVMIFYLLSMKPNTSLLPVPPTNGSYKLSMPPITRGVVLFITLWWTYHPVIPHPQVRVSKGTRSSRTRSTHSTRESSVSAPPQSSSSSSSSSSVPAPSSAPVAASFLAPPDSGLSPSPTPDPTPRTSTEAIPRDSTGDSAESSSSSSSSGNVYVEINA